MPGLCTRRGRRLYPGVVDDVRDPRTAGTGGCPIGGQGSGDHPDGGGRDVRRLHGIRGDGTMMSGSRRQISDVRLWKNTEVFRSGRKRGRSPLGGARSLPCRRCRPVIRRINSATQWARWPVSACTPGWRPRRMNARNIEDPVVIRKILDHLNQKTPRRRPACSLKGGRQRRVCSADVPRVQPTLPAPAGYGRGWLACRADGGIKRQWRGRLFRWRGLKGAGFLGG